MRAPGGLSIDFLGAIESLASAIELREVGALRRRPPSAGRLRRQKVRAVAQLGRAPASGAGGRGFKSHQPDKTSSPARPNPALGDPLSRTHRILTRA